jgi:hypothetical protein
MQRERATAVFASNGGNCRSLILAAAPDCWRAARRFYYWPASTRKKGY